MVAAMAMSIHSGLILEHHEAIPIAVAVDEPKCGKTTGLKYVLASHIWGTVLSK